MLPLHHHRIYGAFLLPAQEEDQPVGLSSVSGVFRRFIFIFGYLLYKYFFLLTLLVFYYSECLNHLCCPISYSTHLPVRQILTCNSSSIRATYYCFLYAKGSLVVIHAFFLTLYTHWRRCQPMVISAGLEPTLQAWKACELYQLLYETIKLNNLYSALPALAVSDSITTSTAPFYSRNFASFWYCCIGVLLSLPRPLSPGVVIKLLRNLLCFSILKYQFSV